MKTYTKIFWCTIKYLILLCFFETINYLIILKLGFEANFLARTILNVLFELIYVPLTVSYIYMLVRKKYKFKRFFSFFSLKHFKFTLPAVLAVSVFYESASMIRYLYIGNINENSLLYSVCTILHFFVCIIRFMLLLLKAKYPCTGFTENIKKTVSIIQEHIGKVVLIQVFFLVFIPLYIFMMHLIDSLCHESYFMVLFNTSMFGTGLLLFPCYILFFDRIYSEKFKLPFWTEFTDNI